MNCRIFVTSIASILLYGCAAIPDHATRQRHADQIAAIARMHSKSIATDGFILASYQRIGMPHAPITVYIEGDGYAWAAPDMPSSDPTPIEPTALMLAAQDAAVNVAYLARPCQYVNSGTDACQPRYWTHARFAPEVIRAYDNALTQLQTQSDITGFHLVGFSGGGAVALLLASTRNDVASVRTVAGNLDHATWTHLHGISPLRTSLNAADASARLSALPQLHLVGAEDTVMPVAVARAYQARFSDSHCIRVEEIGGVSHNEGWQAQWPALLRRPIPCANSSGD